MFGTNKTFTCLTLLVLAITVVLAGCGGGGTSSQGIEAASARNPDEKGKDAEEKNPAAEDKRKAAEEGSKSAADEKDPAKNSKTKEKKKPPKLKASDGNRIRTYGTAASPTETAEVSNILAENLKSREAGEWEVQCASMTVATQEEVAKLAKARALAPCAESLEKIAKPLASTREVRENTLKGPISVFRVEGKTGYALWTDAEGTEWAIPMELEAGEWRVDSLRATAIG